MCTTAAGWTEQLTGDDGRIMSGIRWGILGPGKMARRFAQQLSYAATGRLDAIAGRDGDKAAAFAAEFGAQRSFLSYEQLLTDPEIDAVYIATPHTLHAKWAVRTAEAGKHVLVEKPIAVNYGSAMAVAEAARRNGVVLLEGYMYRFHPQIDMLLGLITDGAIGRIQHIDASFSFFAADKNRWLFDESAAGGGILDVGGYPVSMARLVASVQLGRPNVPRLLAATGLLSDNVDEWATASLEFEGGITAHVRSGVRLSEEEHVVIYGSEGTIQLQTPWVVEPDIRPVITVSRVGDAVQQIECRAGSAYAGEADALALAVASAGAVAASRDVERMTVDDSLANMVVLDQWRDAIGLRYPFERDDADIPTVSGRPLSLKPNAMKYGTITGLEKKVSRLVMGCDNQPNLAHASALFDAFYESGGNTFETAHISGEGLMERLLGQWITNRDVRESVVIGAKGASGPHCNPEALDRQLYESLARLQTDYVDLYMMHGDNEEIPVGEFVDVLEAHARAGRIRVFGGSNWSLARFDEANDYARAHGKQGFGILSNHFALAEAYDAQWIGSRQVTEEASRRWLVKRQVPLFSWSWQSRGFFVRGQPDDMPDAEMVRCYYSDANFERLRRATQLGADLGLATTDVALAYVLHQKFPTFSLLGPRSISEMHSSMAALSIGLTDDQVKWLDLED